MKSRRGHLASPPFVTLYIVAVAAIVLELTRERWGGRAWFPIAVGFVAAAGIIALRTLLKDFVRPSSGKPWRTAVFFFFLAAPLLAGFVFFIPTDPWLALGCLFFAGLFLWAALGTLNRWPGF